MTDLLTGSVEFVALEVRYDYPVAAKNQKADDLAFFELVYKRGTMRKETAKITHRRREVPSEKELNTNLGNY